MPELDYRQVLDGFSDAVIVSDETDRVIYANRAVERLLGWPVAELIGQPLVVLMPERFHAPHLEGFRRFVTTGKGRILGRPVHLAALHRDGTEVEVELTLSAFDADGGRRIVGALRDPRARLELDRQRTANRRILAQYRVMSALAASAPGEDVMPWVLAALGEALDWDVGLYWQVERDPLALRVRASWCAHDADVAPFLVESGRQVLGRGEGLPGQVWAEGRSIWSADVAGEEAYRRRLLAAAQGLASAVLFPVGHGDRLQGVVELLTRRREEPDEEMLQTTATIGFQVGQFLERAAVELERRRNAERATFLADATVLLSSSLDAEHTLRQLAHLAVPRMADWCTIHLADGIAARRLVVAHADPAKVRWAEELSTEYPPDPDAPRGVHQVIRTGEPEIYRDIPDELLVASARDDRHLELLRSLRFRSAMTVPLIARGATLGAITFVTTESGRRYDDEDVRLARALAERAALAVDNARLYADAREAVRVRDEFLSIASHELRTPLTPLQLHVQDMVRRAAGDGPQLSAARLAAKLDTVARQVNRLQSLVENLLDISRITQHRLKVEYEEIDLAELVREVCGRFARSAEHAEVALAIDAPDPVPGAWDRLRVDQIVSNLVSNAIKFGAGKPVNVRVRAQDGVATVIVQDRGIGIAAEDQARIFERFERAVPTRHYGGFGLGLWIVRQIIEALGGTIEVESEIGAGSRFTVALPVRAAALATSAAPAR